MPSGDATEWELQHGATTLSVGDVRKAWPAYEKQMLAELAEIFAGIPNDDLAIHPHGFASRAEDLDLSFDPPPDYSGLAAAAGGAFARMVKRPQDVEAAVAQGLRAVREEQRCAVIDVWLSRL